MPTECGELANAGELVMGAIQIPTPGLDAWPSRWELEQEALAAFGAVKLADCEPRDDDDTAVTWLVVRA